ncbi:hypothetical protein ABPG72_020993 [Tetrahymena utriculariae]
MDQYTQLENLDFAYFQNTISSQQNIKNLSIVFLFLSFQKIICLGMYQVMRFLVDDLWSYQRENWYYFAMVLGVCSYLSSYLSKSMDKHISQVLVLIYFSFFTFSEAYLVHFCINFLPSSIQFHYWIYQLALFAFFAAYFEKYCTRIEFKTLSKIQFCFFLFITFIFVILNAHEFYFILGYGFIFNIIGYVQSYKTIQFLFVSTYGWNQLNFLRSSLDLYVDNQVLFPLALIDTANFVVDAIGYE